MSDELDLDELERLHKASTQGEWKWLGTHWGEAQIAVHDPTSDSSVSGIGLVKYIASRLNFDKKGWDDAAFIATAHNAFPALLARVRELEKDVRLWKPMTPEQAEKELAEVEAEPASEEEINAMLKRILDPAERLNNREETQIRQKILAYRLLLKLKDDELRTARQSIQRLRKALKQSKHTDDYYANDLPHFWTDAEIDAIERGKGDGE